MKSFTEFMNEQSFNEARTFDSKSPYFKVFADMKKENPSMKTSESEALKNMLLDMTDDGEEQEVFDNYKDKLATMRTDLIRVLKKHRIYVHY